MDREGEQGSRDRPQAGEEQASEKRYRAFADALRAGQCQSLLNSVKRLPVQDQQTMLSIIRSLPQTFCGLDPSREAEEEVSLHFKFLHWLPLRDSILPNFASNPRTCL